MADRGSVGFGRRVAPRVAIAGATALDDALAARLLPERPARGHKGTFGKLLVIAGSLDYAGAALLVCRAAGRAGAGLVTLAVPETLQPLFAAKVIEATTMGLPEDDAEETDPEGALARILDHEHDALVIGPGLRPGLATADLVRAIVGVSPDARRPTVEGLPNDAPHASDAPPAVLDAEALRSLASVDRWWEGVRRPCVLTPHPGEFERLRAAGRGDGAGDGDLVGDDEARVSAAMDAARTWGHVVVLKGARTVVAAPGTPGTDGAPGVADGETAIADFENPALATGGTGDVLAGVIGALLAQGLAPFDAARLGVQLHGLAGQLIRERFGDAGLLASDLPDAIALARRRLTTVAERASDARVGFGARVVPDGSAHH